MSAYLPPLHINQTFNTADYNYQNNSLTYGQAYTLFTQLNSGPNFNARLVVVEDRTQFQSAYTFEGIPQTTFDGIVYVGLSSGIQASLESTLLSVQSVGAGYVDTDDVSQPLQIGYSTPLGVHIGNPESEEIPINLFGKVSSIRQF